MPKSLKQSAPLQLKIFKFQKGQHNQTAWICKKANKLKTLDYEKPKKTAKKTTLSSQKTASLKSAVFSRAWSFHGIGQSQQTEMLGMARPNRLKCGYWSDQTGQYVGLVRPRSGYWPDRNVGIGQTKQTECEYWPDQTDQNVGIGQTKQTE